MNWKTGWGRTDSCPAPCAAPELRRARQPRGPAHAHSVRHNLDIDPNSCAPFAPSPSPSRPPSPPHRQVVLPVQLEHRLEELVLRAQHVERARAVLAPLVLPERLVVVVEGRPLRLQVVLQVLHLQAEGAPGGGGTGFSVGSMRALRGVGCQTRWERVPWERMPGGEGSGAALGVGSVWFLEVIRVWEVSWASVQVRTYSMRQLGAWRRAQLRSARDVGRSLRLVGCTPCRSKRGLSDSSHEQQHACWQPWPIQTLEMQAVITATPKDAVCWCHMPRPRVQGQQQAGVQRLGSWPPKCPTSSMSNL